MLERTHSAWRVGPPGMTGKQGSITGLGYSPRTEAKIDLAAAPDYTWPVMTIKPDTRAVRTRQTAFQKFKKAFGLIHKDVDRLCLLLSYHRVS